MQPVTATPAAATVTSRKRRLFSGPPPPTQSPTPTTLPGGFRLLLTCGVRPRGGALYAAKGAVTLVNVSFDDNHAGVSREAVYLAQQQRLFVRDTHFARFAADSLAMVEVPPSDCAAHKPCSSGERCSYAAYSMSCSPCAPNQVSDGIVCRRCAPGDIPGVMQGSDQ